MTLWSLPAVACCNLDAQTPLWRRLGGAVQYLAVLSVSSHGSRRSVGGESTVATMYGAGDYFAL